MTPSPAAAIPTQLNRRAFILRRGIVRYGVPLGAAVFAWVVAHRYGTTLEHLRTRAGWLRLLLLLLLSIGEWTLGAGWLIGSALWYVHQHQLHLQHLDPLERPEGGDGARRERESNDDR